MTRFYTTTVLIPLLLTLLCTSVRAQTVISVMDFDGTPTEMAVSSDVTFFDNNSDGFFGILDTDGDDTDGIPMDTGDGGTTNPTAAINASFLSGDYLYVRDLQDTGDSNGNTQNNGTDGFATVTFGPVNITGETGVSFSFDYQVIGFETADKALYELFIDGVGQGEVDLREGKSTGENVMGSESVCILDGSTSVFLELRIKQNSETDQAAFDNFVVTANSGCTPVCGVSLEEDKLSLVCDAFTSGNSDAVSGSINYLGIEPGVTASITGGASITADSDNPATEEGGTQNNAREIRFTGLTEGGTYTVTIAGGKCSEGREPSFTFTVPSDLCQPVGDIVINEFLPRLATGSVAEFVEIYNRGTETVDISGYTLEEASGARNTVPEGTSLGPGEGLVFADDDNPSNGGCILLEVFGLSLNDDGDMIVLRDASEAIVHQVTYEENDLTPGVSRALNPDGNIDGGYQNHTDVSGDANPYSPCAENVANAVGLPVELVSFTAYAEAKSVRLEWKTANEVANDRFVVERSTSGRQWAQIGTVAALGSDANSYEFSDEAPRAGQNLYRLRQYDLDGVFALYGPVAADFKADIGIYPNPVKNELYLRGFDANAGISLLDASGKTLRELPTGADWVDVASFRPGVYILRVSGGEKAEMLRFIKQ